MLELSVFLEDEGIGIGEGMVMAIGTNEEYSFVVDFDFDFAVPVLVVALVEAALLAAAFDELALGAALDLPLTAMIYVT